MKFLSLYFQDLKKEPKNQTVWTAGKNNPPSQAYTDPEKPKPNKVKTVNITKIYIAVLISTKE